MLKQQIIAGLFALVVSLTFSGAVLAQESGVESDGTAINEDGTVIYDQEFFARFPNAVSVADILTRIPGGEQALNSGGGNARGFSRNQDNILINGKRLSGKSNDSRSALERITVEQVERIEVIRGSSPDIKVSSQQAIYNIVTKEGGSGSGSWEAQAIILTNGNVQPGGKLSYGASKDGFEYFVSFSREPLDRGPYREDRFFDGSGLFTNQVNEVNDVNRAQTQFAANLGFTFDNGDQIRLNGQYNNWQDARTWDGTLFDSDGMGGLVFTGNSFRLEDTSRPSFEIGGDFTKELGDKWSLKIIGLYSQDDRTFVQSEDFDITGDEIEEDVLSIENKIATEAIGRVSATWTPNPTHSLEVGTELTTNKLDAALQFFEREGDMLVPQDVAGAVTTVKETRNESFFIHTWQLGANSSLETSLFTEWSRISQSGDLNNARTFFFFRPSFDFRHNLNEQDQLQVSIRRRVGQLDFEEFATRVSQDGEIVGGNPNLRPWKRWEIEIGYEHRLNNDKGFYKATFLYWYAKDATEQIEISPGISGEGNIGDANSASMTFEVSYRFTDLGLPNLVVNTRATVQRVRITDYFTGEKRRPDWGRSSQLRVEVRHDVRPLKFSWGLTVNRDAEETFHDINEVVINTAPRYWGELFVEKTLFSGIVFRTELANVFNPNAGRFRSLYEDGRVGGVVTSTETRYLKYGRRVMVSLKGTF